MAKGYLILTEKIHDPEGMKAYSQAAGKAIATGAAKVIVANREPEVVEGEWPATQTVVVEFESAQAAHDWYWSDDYQAAAKIRQAAADCDAIIIEGFDAPGS